MSQIEMFALNMFLLPGILIVCVCGFLLLIALITALKIGWWQMRRLVAYRAVYGTKCDEQGRPLPQAFRGGCTRCGNVFRVVYSVSEHRQLCKRCYQIECAEQVGTPGCSSLGD